MRNIIIYFTIKDTAFRLVTGHNTGRNDLEKSEPDRRAEPTWQPVGYNVAGLPTAESILQAALLRAFSRSTVSPEDATQLVDEKLCQIDDKGDLTITLLSGDLKLK